MNRMYYQDAHACVIMFDVTYDKSLEICLKWKQDLDSKCTLDSGEPIPCILLANKVSGIAGPCCFCLYLKPVRVLGICFLIRYDPSHRPRSIDPRDTRSKIYV